MPHPLDGGCLCGAVRYRIAEPALSAGTCHCRTCRRAAGAQSVAWATVTAAGFAWLAGEPASHASSPGVRRSHCAACGTSLTYHGEPDTVDVTIASLDDPEAIRPGAEIWTSHRLSWEPLDPALPHLSEGGAG
jgi:hypothetical protein